MFLKPAIHDFIYDITNDKIKPHNFLKRVIFCFWGFSSKDCDDYYLYRRNICEVLREFIPYYRRMQIRGNSKSPSSKILQNKYETLRILNANFIPTSTPSYLIIEGDTYLLNKNMELGNKTSIFLPGDYVIKPINLRWGEDIVFFQINKKVDVMRCSVIKEAVRKHKILLIEKRLCNHAVMDKLSIASLNTLRIITVRSKTNEIIVIFACVRFSSSENRIDNWSAGGFAANIDINTGIAQVAVKKDWLTTDKYNTITKGFLIPFFDDAKQIAINAHKVFRDMKSIGWDIAITPNGPIIIEGNDDWDVILPQKLLQKGIKDFLCRK